MGIDARLAVSEIFGATFQGEGPTLGRRASFVRLGRCGLACRWCDTPFSWDWARYDPDVELSAWSPSDILGALEAMHAQLVVITGGEPLLQQRALVPLVQGCRQRGWQVEVETAGVIAPLLEGVGQWNVSPKLSNSGMEPSRRYRPEVLRAFEATGRAVFKFVASGPADLDEISVMVNDCGLSQVWVMPEGTDAATVLGRLQALAPAVLDRGWNLTPRLQVLIWGDRRGV